MALQRDVFCILWIAFALRALGAPQEPGAPAASKIAAARNADGRLEVFFLGEDGFLYRKRQAEPDGGWADAAKLGGPAKGAAVGQNTDGRLELFFIGADDFLYRTRQTSPGGNWPGASKLAEKARDLAMGRNADGRLELFFIGADDFLYSKWQTSASGAWSDAARFGGQARDVAVGQNADGRLEVLFAGADGVLYHKWQIAPSDGWDLEQEFAPGAQRVKVGRNADGRLEAFFVGPDDLLYHKWQIAPNSAWSAEQAFAGPARAVEVGANHDGRLEVLFTDLDDVLHHQWQIAPNGIWSTAAQFGWTATDLATEMNADGRLEAFYLGADGLVYHDEQLAPGVHWAGEYPFADAFESPVSVDAFGPEPAYAPGPPNWHVNDHCFIRGKDGTWHMFGIVAPNPDEPDPPVINYFGHATASALDQRPWKEEAPPFYESLAGGKVVWAPHVIRHGETFFLFYCSGGALAEYAISLRTSSDLKSWSAPVELFRDGFQARDPMVLRIPEENLFVLYYCATDSAGGGHHVVAYRTGEDLLRWSGRGIAYADFHEGTGYGPTESPFVVRRGERFYLFIGPRPYDPPSEALPNWEHPGYVGTDVFSSARWDRWTNADWVAHIPAHALEVAQDASGEWYASSAGIERGGLYLARLRWRDGPGGSQRPGDANQDGGLDLSDAIWLLGHLFLGTSGQLPCDGSSASRPGAGDLALADINGDGRIDISDPVAVLSFLFLGTRPPALGTGCVAIPGCPDVCGLR